MYLVTLQLYSLTHSKYSKACNDCVSSGLSFDKENELVLTKFLWYLALLEFAKCLRGGEEMAWDLGEDIFFSSSVAFNQTL